MIRVLATDGMQKAAVEKLKNSGFEVVEQFYEPEELKEQVKNFDVVVVRSATKIRQPIIDAALETKKLKLVIRGGVGVDNIDVDYAKMNGIEVRNTPNASSASVAELTIGHMFSIARYIGISNFTMRNGKWNKKKYEGIELGGKTLGLIGFGRIAREVAKRAKALGMKIIYTDIFGPFEGYEEFKFMTLDELISSADFISLHIPAAPDKKAVIGSDQIAKMKDGVFIVNCARGGVVDENALLDALDSGKVAAAALDVYEEEPTTAEAQERIGEEIIDIITKFFV